MANIYTQRQSGSPLAIEPKQEKNTQNTEFFLEILKKTRSY